MRGLEELRRATRTLNRRRGFAAAAIAVMAIGVCGFTMMYSIVSERLLRPIRFPEPDRLVAVFQVLPDLRDRAGMQRLWNSFGFSYSMFRELQSRAPAFETVGALTTASRVLSSNGPAERVEVIRASVSTMALFAVRPAAGRAFVTGEDEPGATPVAMISVETWRSRFGHREDVIGQRLRLDGTDHEIVGVLPEGFTLPRAVTPGIWIPIGSDPDDARPRSSALSLVGRLRAGASIEEATRQATNVLQALVPSEPIESRVAGWQHEVTKNVRRPLIFFLLCASVLLLLSMVSVAGLLAIDMHSRFVEFATRMAIGATRLRLLAQLSAESMVLSAISVTLGLWFAMAALPLLQSAAVNAMPFLRGGRIGIQVSAVVAGMTAFACVAATLMVSALTIGTSPTAQLTRRLQRTASPRTRTTGLTIVTTQFALSTLLLIGGGLLALNVYRVSRVDPGFDPERLVVVNVDIGRDSREPQTAIPVFTSLAERLRILPGVERVDIASAIPFSGGNSSGELMAVRETSMDTVNVRFSNVMPGFFDGLGLRLLGGRSFDDTDRSGAPLVGIVNQTMARELWPGQSPLGAVVQVGENRFTIVGIVSDVRHTSLADATLPTLYRPELQSHSRFLQLLVRVMCRPGDCSAIDARSIRAAVAEVVPSAVVNGADRMQELVARSFAPDRFRAGLTLIFAVLAGLLTIVGIYGTTVRSVQRARHEIAVRMALGSSVRGMVKLFVVQFAATAALGAASGSVVAWVASGTVGPYLSLVSAREPAVYGSVAVLTVVVAVLTAWFGARGIAAVDPAGVLKD